MEEVRKQQGRIQQVRRRQERMDRRQERRRKLEDDNLLNTTPKLEQTKRGSRNKTVSLSFSRFSKLPPEIRVAVWKNTLQGRIIKISPKLWDSKYKCRNIHWKGQTENARPHLCMAHSHPDTKPPATFSTSFEARKNTMMFYQHLELGQPAAIKPLWANLEIDTVLINDCLGPIGTDNALLSKRGFSRSLFESPGWHQIQHLALDWTNYRSADVARRTRRVLTREILKMRSIKTVTMIGDYTWKDGVAESLMSMAQNTEKANIAGLIRLGRDETAAAAYEKFLKKVETEWEKSVKLASSVNLLQGIRAVPVVEFRVKIMNMAGGPIDKYWERD